MDCETSYPAVCMDFDHRDPSKKICSVSEAAKKSYDLMINEISKCDVVCSNCHRIRTAKRLDGYSGEF